MVWRPTAARGFSLLLVSRLVLGAIQPSVQWTPQVLSLWVEWQRNDTDHSLPSSTEVKNTCSSTCTPSHFFMTWRRTSHLSTILWQSWRSSFLLFFPKNKGPTLYQVLCACSSMYLSYENGTQFYKAICIQSTQHITGTFLQTHTATFIKK